MERLGDLQKGDMRKWRSVIKGQILANKLSQSQALLLYIFLSGASYPPRSVWQEAPFCPENKWFAHFAFRCTVQRFPGWAEPAVLQAGATELSQEDAFSEVQWGCYLTPKWQDFRSTPSQMPQAVVQQSHLVLQQCFTTVPPCKWHKEGQSLWLRACNPFPKKQSLSILLHSLPCSSFSPCCR